MWLGTSICRSVGWYVRRSTERKRHLSTLSQRSSKAFTLVEILCVLALLGLLFFGFSYNPNKAGLVAIQRTFLRAQREAAMLPNRFFDNEKMDAVCLEWTGRSFHCFAINNQRRWPLFHSPDVPGLTAITNLANVPESVWSFSPDSRMPELMLTLNAKKVPLKMASQ